MPEQALVPFVTFALFPKHAGLVDLAWLWRWRSGLVKILALVSPIALPSLEIVANALLPRTWDLEPDAVLDPLPLSLELDLPRPPLALGRLGMLGAGAPNLSP